MILRANIRGNGGQLAMYLHGLKDNSHVRILEVDGRENADELYLQQTLLSMQLNSELTKTDKAFFNVQINPAYGEDNDMTDEDWHKAADILAKETGYENQRRVIVLHTKKGRTHAHVVWERYNHATGKMIDNKNSRLKVDRARPKMEAALKHEPTPYRNPQRPELKIAATKLWNNTKTGAEFLTATRKAGFIVAEGTGNRPFMIVDETGRAFDLVRQLDGVKTKEVRQRLRNEKLITDKQAIEEIRQLQEASSGKREKQRIDHRPAIIAVVSAFAENREKVFVHDLAELERLHNVSVTHKFVNQGKELTKQPEPDKPIVEPTQEDDHHRKLAVAADFANNRGTILSDDQVKVDKRQKIVDEQERLKQRARQRKPR